MGEQEVGPMAEEELAEELHIQLLKVSSAEKQDEGFFLQGREHTRQLPMLMAEAVDDDALIGLAKFSPRSREGRVRRGGEKEGTLQAYELRRSLTASGPGYFYTPII